MSNHFNKGMSDGRTLCGEIDVPCRAVWSHELVDCPKCLKALTHEFGEEIPIVVMQVHIDNGAISDCKICPIALAAHSSGLTGAVIDPDLIQVDILGIGRVDMDLPLSAQDFISYFDCGKEVKPFSFTVKASECDVI